MMATLIAIHIFAGTDDYTSLTTIRQWKEAFVQKHALAAAIEIDGDADSEVVQKAVQSVAGTPSLFATATLVVVRQPFSVTDKAAEQAIEQLWAAAAPSELVVLMWQRGDPDKRRVLYKRARSLILDGKIKWHQSDIPGGNQLTTWIIQRARGQGVQIASDAASYMAQALAGDPVWSIVNALDLLVLAAGESKKIELALVKTYVTPRFALDSFGVTDSIVAGNQQQALRALGNYTLMRNPTMGDGVALLGALTWLIRMAARIKSGDARSISPFVVRKIEPFAQRVDERQLHTVWHQAAEADQQVKSGNEDLVAACESLVWSLLRL